MILKSDKIASLLKNSKVERDPLVIVPAPDICSLEKAGTASIDLRLGTWFVTTKARRHALLDIYETHQQQPTEHDITNKYYVPFQKSFILHPHSFVLTVTLEWIRMPGNLAGYIMGKSSWGRRGLIIETAPGVHPGFSGCLTLELANVGEIPIAIKPGIQICQLYLHEASSNNDLRSQSAFVGQRQPTLGKIEIDEFARKLAT